MWSSTVIVLSLFVFKFAHNENTPSKTWVDATRECRKQGLILESNTTVIQHRIGIRNKNSEVWIGKYETFTGWAYIKDCVEIKIDPRSKPLNVANGTERNICQGLCKDNRYFGVKNKFCICLDNISPFSKCKCNLNDCVIIWEHHNTTNVQDIDIDAQCIAAQNCNENKEVVRTYVKCDQSLLTECYIIQPHQLLSCHSINKQGNITTYNTEACKMNQFYFSCRNESSIDDLKPAIIYPPETTANESSTAGAVVGSFIAVIAVTVLIIVAVIFLKRRAKKKNDAPSKAETSLGYKFRVTQNSKIKTHKTNYDYPTVAEINNDKFVNINYSIAKPIKDEKGDDYSFAQPLDSGGDYAYDSDYDHFNSPVKQSNDSSQYTSADQAVKIYGDKKGTYDHLSSFERKTIDKESCSNSNYDHLPNITGSDPTYDVSGNVIHDDSDKYDHVPTNFKTGRSSSDYQSTRLFPGSVKDESYDHFELKE